MSNEKKEINFIPILIAIAVVLVLIGVGLTVSERFSKKKATPTYASAGYETEKNEVKVEDNNIVNSTESNVNTNNVNATNNNVATNQTTENKTVVNNTASTETKKESTIKEATETTNTSAAKTTSKNRKIDPKKPMVAITFDDGPNNTATPKILNTLEKYGVVATFFDLGQNITYFPKVVKREEAIGCEVASHTYAHKNLNTLSAKQIQKDLNKAVKAYEDVLGHKPALVRPPYGNANATVKKTINYPLINWDIDTLDWKSRNAKKILKEIHKYSDYDGRIILMHGIYDSTADAVATLVPELINKGYQLVTVSEMAQYKGVTLKPGKVYLNFRK